MFDDFLGSCDNWLGYFLLQFLEKLRLLFISTSGHTDCKQKIDEVKKLTFENDFCLCSFDGQC